MKIVEFLLETLAAQGVRCIFGNPGTTEIPLVRACEQRKAPQYIVALSEVAAVPMADGYARSTRSLGVVNLHVAPGLGNGMGALYTAGIAGTPLLVLIGGQDRRFLHTDPILWGPVEQMAGSVCKSVYTMHTGHDAAASVRRALRAALTPPYAPVALVCPPDLLEDKTTAVPGKVVAPALAGLSAEDAALYARLLGDAKNPAFIAAEDVHWSDAASALEALATRLSAPVYAAPYTGALPVSSSVACYAGYLPPSFKQIGERLAPHDFLLFVGGRGLRTTLHSEVSLSQRKAWLGHDGSVQPAGDEFDIARVADIANALRTIARHLGSTDRSMSEPSMRPAVAVPERRGAALHPSRAVHKLLLEFTDAVWIDESGLSTSDVRQWMQLDAGRYFINGSGGIGWGLAAAVGAAIGASEHPVVALIGDGSALYASEALWTAAHHATRMALIVISNRRYATLNEAAGRLAGGPLRSFTIEPPAIDFSGLAKLHAWNYARAATEEELDAWLASQAKALKGNALLELVIDPAVRPVTASRHF